MHRLVFASVLATLIAVLPAAAQEPAPSDTLPPTPDRPGAASVALGPTRVPDAYGVTGYSVFVVPPVSFIPSTKELGYIGDIDGYIYAEAASVFEYSFDAPVYLPTGALLNSTKAFVYDANSSGYVEVFLLAYNCSGSSGCTKTILMDQQTDTAGTPGYTILTDSSAMGITWKNLDQDTFTVNYATVGVSFSIASWDLKIGPVYIYYQRQVSPAPASATFSDVPTSHWAFRYIEALASSGITAGCGGGDFCPDQPLTRAQMAVFLAKAMGLDYPDFRP